MMMKIQIKSKFLVLFVNIISAETASESGFSASERFQVLKRNRFYYVNSFVIIHLWIFGQFHSTESILPGHLEPVLDPDFKSKIGLHRIFQTNSILENCN